VASAAASTFGKTSTLPLIERLVGAYTTTGGGTLLGDGNNTGGGTGGHGRRKHPNEIVSW
jgi:hypothetical protein